MKNLCWGGVGARRCTSHLLNNGVAELAEGVDACSGHALLDYALQREVGDLGGLLVLGGDIRVGQVRYGLRFLGLLNLLLSQSGWKTINL